MKEELRLKELAGEHGQTLANIAKKLGIYRSNMSAIASGARGASLDVLKRICLILDCSLDELIPIGKEAAVFKSIEAQRQMKNLEKINYDGTDKTWVNRVMLAQKVHYKSARRAE